MKFIETDESLIDYEHKDKYKSVLNNLSLKYYSEDLGYSQKRAIEDLMGSNGYVSDYYFNPLIFLIPILIPNIIEIIIINKQNFDMAKQFILTIAAVITSSLFFSFLFLCLEKKLIYIARNKKFNKFKNFVHNIDSICTNKKKLIKEFHEKCKEKEFKNSYVYKNYFKIMQTLNFVDTNMENIKSYYKYISSDIESLKKCLETLIFYKENNNENEINKIIEIQSSLKKYHKVQVHNQIILKKIQPETEIEVLKRKINEKKEEIDKVCEEFKEYLKITEEIKINKELTTKLYKKYAALLEDGYPEETMKLKLENIYKQLCSILESLKNNIDNEIDNKLSFISSIISSQFSSQFQEKDIH